MILNHPDHDFKNIEMTICVDVMILTKRCDAGLQAMAMRKARAKSASLGL